MMMFFRREILFTPIVIVLFFQSIDSHALGLLDAYEAALENDSVYRSAIHENEAGQQEEAIGRSALLPNLSFTHARSKNTGSITSAGTQTPLNFDSEVSTLSLRQPILNLEAVAGYRQGAARANSSHAKFTGHSQQLIVRLVEAYVETLLAQDRLMLAEAQQETFEERKKVNEQMLQKGEGTVTDVLETKSKYALAQAEVIEARDEYEVAQLRLETIVGNKDIVRLHRLSTDFSVNDLQMVDFESWQELALNRNAELVTQRYTITSSKEEIKKRRSGHMPRLDLVASLSRNNSASFITADRDADIASIGIEVNVPIYAGGRVNAVTSQSVANHARAEAELDAMTDSVLVELRKQYQLILSSVKRIESLELAVESAHLLVEATEKSIQGGLRINLDLLDAQEQLFSAQGELSQARYNYLLAFLRLKLAAGDLVLQDLQKIATYFDSTS
ncbi:MAG: TolC family outer membrane protein [Nitrosomonas sp.]|nr:TolC family outer membrane protein [Nitrosomonas sp.]